MKPNHCAIVSDEGPDVLGRSLDEIVLGARVHFSIFTIGSKCIWDWHPQHPLTSSSEPLESRNSITVTLSYLL
jgi:hypothetical protein